jgi:hypothetical protein
VDPASAYFLLSGLLLMAGLSLAAVGLVTVLRWLGVDLSAWDDPPVAPCPCADGKPCLAHPYRTDWEANPPRPWKAW